MFLIHRDRNPCRGQISVRKSNAITFAGEWVSNPTGPPRRGSQHLELWRENAGVPYESVRILTTLPRYRLGVGSKGRRPLELGSYHVQLCRRAGRKRHRKGMKAARDQPDRERHRRHGREGCSAKTWVREVKSSVRRGSVSFSSVRFQA